MKWKKRSLSDNIQKIKARKVAKPCGLESNSYRFLFLNIIQESIKFTVGRQDNRCLIIEYFAI